MPILPHKSDMSFPPIVEVIFYKNKQYKYMKRDLGKLLDIFYDNRHTWMQWVFHFEKEVLCFSEKDPQIKQIVSSERS